MHEDKTNCVSTNAVMGNKGHRSFRTHSKPLPRWDAAYRFLCRTFVYKGDSGCLDVQRIPSDTNCRLYSSEPPGWLGTSGSVIFNVSQVFRWYRLAHSNSFIPSGNWLKNQLFKRRKGINIALFQDLIGFFSKRIAFCRPLNSEDTKFGIL
jgi:hypothetical protein